MKKLLQFIIIFLLNKGIQAQISLNATAHWNQSRFYHSSALIISSVSDITVAADTIIGGKKYFKLKEKTETEKSTGVDSMGIIVWVKTNEPIQTRYLYLRADSNRFYVLNEQFIENLLYDFSIKQGSEYTKAVFDFACSTVKDLIFEQEDTVCLGLRSVRRFRLSPRNYPSANYLIENIGPNTGLFSPFCKNGCPECAYQLNYFTLDNDTLYKGNCNQSAFIPEAKKTRGYEIYYSDNAFHVDFKSSGTIKIYNVLGQYLLTESRANGGIVDTENLGLKTGIYLIEIESDWGREYVKILQP